MKKIVFLIFMLIGFVALADTNPFDRIYDPYHDIKDLSFTLKSQELSDLIREKLLLKKETAISFKVYYLAPNRLEVDIKSSEEKSLSSVEKNIKEQLVAYFKQFFNLTRSLSLASLTPSIGKGGEYVFKNLDGDSELTEVIIINKKREVVQIVRQPIGTTRVSFELEEVPWSKKMVIKKVSGKDFVGSEVLEYDALLSYEKQSSHWHLPVALIIGIKQMIKDPTIENYELERVLSESMYFSDYEVNKGSALRWFSKQ